MIPDILKEQFHLLADAPGGVQKLRELILQLAVQGKLVEQDPSEPPASETLKKIHEEKAQLLKEGKIRKEKPISAITHEEIPEWLPEKWTVGRLGKMLYVIRGASPRPKGDPRYFSSTRTPYHWIKISDIRKYSEGWVLKDTDEFLTEAGSKKSVYLEAGTFLLSNSATIGVPTVLGINGCIHDGYLAFPYLNNDLLNMKFLYFFFLHFKKTLESRAFGGAQLNLNTGIVKSIAFPLPPELEQARIVSRVEELLSICDNLEAKQQQRDKKRITLNNACLHSLTTANRSNTAPAWNRIRDNFDLLYSCPENVAALRQAILQLAVQGRLVPQDESDEPVSRFLDQIGANEIKPASKETAIIPDGWKAVRLKDLGVWVGGGTPSKRNPAFWKGNIPWVSPKDMKRDLIDVVQDSISELAVENSSVKLIQPGAILMVVRGMILAHSFPVAVAGRALTINQDMKALQLFDDVIRDYLLLFLKASLHKVLELVERSSHGTCRLPTAAIKELKVLIPPIKEQRRIVKKVERLLNWCREIELSLKNTSAWSSELTKAIIERSPN